MDRHGHAETAGLVGRHSRSRVSGSDERDATVRGTVVQERSLARGLESLASVSLLRRLEQAVADLSALIENFDDLPEAYSSGSPNWDSYEDLESACEAILMARVNLMGDR